jgi:hypothetical protein
MGMDGSDSCRIRISSSPQCFLSFQKKVEGVRVPGKSVGEKTEWTCGRREKALLHVPVNQQEEMEAGEDEISSSMPLSSYWTPLPRFTFIAFLPLWLWSHPKWKRWAAEKDILGDLTLREEIHGLSLLSPPWGFPVIDSTVRKPEEEDNRGRDEVSGMRDCVPVC